MDCDEFIDQNWSSWSGDPPRFDFLTNCIIEFLLEFGYHLHVYTTSIHATTIDISAPHQKYKNWPSFSLGRIDCLLDRFVLIDALQSKPTVIISIEHPNSLEMIADYFKAISPKILINLNHVEDCIIAR